MGLLFDLAAAEVAHHAVYGKRRHHREWTQELIGGAAGFEATRMYERHREREGIVGHHKLGKELIAGFAAAEAVKLFEGRELGRLDRERARRHATAQAEHLYGQRYRR
jgi:hypothetical protein